MPNSKYAIDEARSEALRIIGNFQKKAAEPLRRKIENELVIVREAKTYDHLLLGIRTMLVGGFFPQEVQNELKELIKFINTVR